MDINIELNDIIFKYGLDAVYPAYKGYLEAQHLIDELIKNWSDKKVLCLCNSSINRYYFENRIPQDEQKVEFCQLNFGCFNADKSSDFAKIFQGYHWEDYDIVCIIGYNGSSYIGHQLRLNGIKYVHLYDFFASKGLYLNHEWYDFLHHEKGYISYEENVRLYTQRNSEIQELFDLRQRYNSLSPNEDEVARVLLKQIIFVSLFVHDFLNANKYLELYIGLTQDHDYKLAKMEIDNLLNLIKKRLAECSRRDIIINWVDKVPYKDMKYAEYLSTDIKENSVFFEQMYTMCPFTGPSFIQMFGEGKPVDDGGWGDWFTGGRGVEGWSVIRDIEESGYEFMSFDYNFRSFPKRFIPAEPIDSYVCASDLLWKVLSYIINSDKPKVVYTHICLETHEPFWSMLMDDEMINDNDTRYHNGIRAVDQQLRFYSGLYNDEMVKIYLSDHGKEDYQSRFHCFFAIQSREYAPRIVDDLCCWLDFGKIMHALLNGNEIPFCEIKREYVQLQEFNWISGEPQALVVKNKKPITWLLMGFRGALTKDYIYMKFNTGVEWFKKNDENASDILEPTWFQRDDDIDPDAEQYLDQYRNWAGKTKQSEVEKYNKYNKYIQKIFDKAFARNLKKIEEINRLFDSFGDEPVQLRMGGYHSERLYSILSSNNRKKIKYVIDINPRCMMCKFNVPVISKPREEGIVVLSSHDYLAKLIKESKGYVGVRVVDVYRHLEEKGFKCRMPVYELEPLPEEYDVGFPLEDFERYE